MSDTDDRYSTGLIVGRFCPPHLGHRFVIGWAAQRCERLVVFVNTRDGEVVPGTLRVISARMDYLPRDTDEEHWREREFQRQADARQAVVSVYARGRDYHKVLRQRLQSDLDSQ